MSRILLDTGPLVSLIDRSDRHHEWVREQFDGIKPPLYTCEAVVAEAIYLLSSVDLDATAPLDLLSREVLRIDFDLEAEAAAVRELVARYAPRMDLADACLVRMSEADRHARVLTLDGDFRIYRRHGRQVIPVIAPEAASVRKLRRGRGKRANRR